MAEERRGLGKHNVTMDEREKITITGVVDVLSFDEESVACDTSMGILFIRGNNLHVSKLNLDNGELAVEGEVDMLEYSDTNGFSKTKGSSLLGRLFK